LILTSFYLIIIIICYAVFIAFNINHSSILPLMALNSVYYADMPFSNYSLTHSSLDCSWLYFNKLATNISLLLLWRNYSELQT